MSGRKDFLSQQAPENYVAGLGRGATGFTTRSDLGPAREGPSEDQIKEALAKRAAALGNAPPTAYGVPKKKDDEQDEDQFRDAENEEGLFATGNYDRDDDEADRIYQSVDERMDKRRRNRRYVLLLTLPFPPVRACGCSSALQPHDRVLGQHADVIHEQGRTRTRRAR